MLAAMTLTAAPDLTFVILLPAGLLIVGVVLAIATYVAIGRISGH
jgi:hypothetical protein